MNLLFPVICFGFMLYTVYNKVKTLKSNDDNTQIWYKRKSNQYLIQIVVIFIVFIVLSALFLK